MKTAKLTLILIAGLTLGGCGVKNKMVKTELQAVRTYDSLAVTHAEATLVTYQYGEVLTGTFRPDTNGEDSTTFESKGIKGKIKTKKTPKGLVIDYELEAKPVARSELKASTDTNNQVKKTGSVSVKNEENKSTFRLSGWVWFALALIVIGIVAVVISKIRTKLKSINELKKIL